MTNKVAVCLYGTQNRLDHWEQEIYELWKIIYYVATLNLKYYILTDRLIMYLKMQFGNQKKLN